MAQRKRGVGAALSTAGRDVFVNCPFDEAYRPLFRAIVFTVSFAGFRPRCALEKSNAGEPRIVKIMRIIQQCQFGIHDISRTELDASNGLPRFNMPLELGIFLGMMHSGNPDHAQKECLVLDRESYRYQKFISDIAGQDVVSHRNDPATAVRRVRNWLVSTGVLRDVPSPDRALQSYGQFASELDAMAAAAGFSDAHELTYNDLITLIWGWIDAAREN